jgi:catechol 2,3-dioxygenase-like lactoylglutathione lyase family enzyme
MSGTRKVGRLVQLGAALALVLALVTGATAAQGAQSSPAPPLDLPAPVPGVLGVDHMGITVPNVREARRWFVDVMGCSAPLSFGPFADPKGTLMTDLLGVDRRAVVQHINMIRCGTGSSIELLQYSAPHQSKRFARNSDYAGHHVAFYVQDIAKAAAYLEAHHVKKFLGPFPVTAGPAAGQTINYFKTPFGLYIELISYPNGEAYEQTATTRLWNPRDVGATPGARGVPGLLGIDHFGITVPNITHAREWLVQVMGCTAPLQFGPFLDPTGNLMTNLVDVHPRSVIHQINVVRCGQNGANIELLRYTAPDQNRHLPLNSDYAANHIAFYVKSIKPAVAAMTRVRKLLGPFPVTGGPAKGQRINYFLTPLRHYVELISYPGGMAYEKTVSRPLWSPRKPTS